MIRLTKLLAEVRKSIPSALDKLGTHAHDALSESQAKVACSLLAWLLPTVDDGGTMEFAKRGGAWLGDSIRILQGPSGTGKTFVANLVARLKETTRHHGPVCILSFTQLDDMRLLASFQEIVSHKNQLFANARELSDFLSLPGCPNFFVIHDCELSQVSPRLQTLFYALIEELRSSNKLVLITTTRQLEITGAKTDFIEYPDWDDSSLKDLPDIRGSADCVCTMLAYELSQKLKEPAIVDTLGSAYQSFLMECQKFEDKSVHKHVWISCLHRKLYAALLKRLGPENRDTLHFLLAWASVDPGFDLFDIQEESGDICTRHLTRFADYTKQDIVNSVFFTIDNRPRLAHSSVLDIYSDSSLVSGDAIRSQHDQIFHYLRAQATKLLDIRRSSRMRLHAHRHQLRSKPEQRTFDLLAELDDECFPGLGAADHELAMAYLDFAEPFLTKEQRRARSPEFVWYQPQGFHRMGVAVSDPKDPLLSLTSLTLMADTRYQALDEWDEASHHISSIQESLDDLLAHRGPEFLSDALKKRRLSNLCLLVAGFHSAMNYEGGGSLPTLDKQRVCGFQAGVAAQRIADVFTLHRNWGSIPDDLYLSLRANEAICQIKSEPVKNYIAKSHQHQQLPQPNDYRTALRNIPAVEKLINRSNEVRTQGSMRDWARYQLIIARHEFLLNGPQRAIDVLLHVLDARGVLGESQELVYAFIQTEYYRLYCGLQSDGDEQLWEWARNSHDSWARYQVKALESWREYAEAGCITNPSWSERHELLASRFSMDIKAELACLIGAAVVRGITEEKQLKEIYQTKKPNFLEEDHFYRFAVQRVTENQQYDDTLLSTWFPGDMWRSLGFGPIMPAMLILRCKPVSYVPK